MNAESRRPSEATGSQMSTAADSLMVARPACPHLRVRFCRRCVDGRRRAQRELDELAPLHSPTPRPSTFLLTPEELRQLANEYVSAGWSADEVVQVLDVERRRGGG